MEAVPEEEEQEMVEEEPEDEEPAFRRQELIERYHVSKKQVVHSCNQYAKICKHDIYLR